MVNILQHIVGHQLCCCLSVGVVLSALYSLQYLPSCPWEMGSSWKMICLIIWNDDSSVPCLVFRPFIFNCAYAHCLLLFMIYVMCDCLSVRFLKSCWCYFCQWLPACSGTPTGMLEFCISLQTFNDFFPGL